MSIVHPRPSRPRAPRRVAGPSLAFLTTRAALVGAAVLGSVAVGTALGARTASAQAGAAPSGGPAAGAIAGVVRDSVTGRPLGGAVVQLRDSLDRTVAQALTDDRGRYRVAGAGTARRLRVVHIGFRPAEQALPGAGASGYAVALAPVPPLLAPVRVAAGAAPRCGRGGNTPAALGLLDQVRAGLLATVIARTESPARVTVLNFERQLDPRRDDGDDTPAAITRQTVHVQSTDGTTAPFGASRSGATFVADGFRAEEGGRARFYAPDAETLVDDDFAAGYCFRVVTADGDRGHDVGLGFGPARRRDGRVDVDGVLWVDTVARTLHDLTFRYVGLDGRVEALHPGGRLSFHEMPTGVPFVDRWALRLVTEQAAPRRAPRGASGYEAAYDRDDAPRLDVAEIGGELARAVWSDGRVWDAPLAHWRLQLTDVAGHPAAGAEVRLEQTDYAIRADSLGVAQFPDLLPGPYTASIVDPMLAAAGRGHLVTQRAVVVRDSTVQTRAAIEMAERVAEVPRPANAPARATAGIPIGSTSTVSRSPQDTTVSIAPGSRTVEQLFTGRFAGVTVEQASDGGLRIQIRGGAASGNGEPLYLVDGTPVAEGTGGIVHLNPYDIERIEVLKNPQDIGVYGLRGANGVIRITTIRPGHR